MSGLVIGLVAGLAAGALVIFCCVRSVCKEKKAISRQVKQVQQVDEDPHFDDVEAPTPPSEQNTHHRRDVKANSRPVSTSATATTATTKKAGGEKRAPAPVAAAAAKEAPRVVAPAHAAAPPSYDDLEAIPSAAAAAAAPVASTPTHVYGDDSEEFQGRHEFQSAGDPYDAPVRVSKSTERRSGNFRPPSPGHESRTLSSRSSSRGRSEVKEGGAAVRVS